MATLLSVDDQRAHSILQEYVIPGDDPQAEPVNTWRGHGHLLFGNWINQVYQTTPFDLNDIGRG